MPKISIIVPVYNTESYLFKCLQSLVNQTFQDIEIIVVNDGSTDNSQRIIDIFTENYPNKIRAFFKENGGQAIARNWAIDLSEGDYIGFMDSDDYAAPDLYELMYTAAIKENVDMVMCDYYLTTQQEEKVIQVKTVEETKDLLIDPKVAPWNKLYKASVIKQSGVKFHENLIYEDTAFYANLVPYIYKCINVHKPLLYHVDFRVGSTTSVIDAERCCQMFPIMDGIIDYYIEHNFYEKYKEELEYFYSKMLLGSSFVRIVSLPDKEERKQYLRKSIEKVEKNFPLFRKNKYYKGSKMGIYMKSMKTWNICFVGYIVRLIWKMKKY